MTTMRRRVFSRRIWFGPSVSVTSATRCSGTRPEGGRDEEVAQRRGRAVLVGEPHHHVEAAVALDDLRDRAPVGQAFEGLGDGGGRDAVERRATVVDVDAELRDADLLLDLQVHDARDLAQPLAEAARQGPKRIEVVPEHLQRDLGPDAGQHVIEPVGDRLPHVEHGREHGKAFPDVGHDLFLAALGAL
jgi:hypothetical protein